MISSSIYEHVKVPPAFAHVEGLVCEDLGELTFNEAVGAYVPANPEGLDADKIIAAVHAEMSSLAEEAPGEQGFPGQPK